MNKIEPIEIICNLQEKHLLMHLFMKPLYKFAVDKQKKHKGWSKEEIRKDVVRFHVLFLLFLSFIWSWSS